MSELLGFHHITAIVGDVQANVDCYAGLLGLRLVKTTVNFDDPQTYHLYFGDGAGRPGTLITFFPWTTGRWGGRGTGQISAIAFAVPNGSLDYWAQRLQQANVRYAEPVNRFDEQVLQFYDPAGLWIELVARRDAELAAPWEQGPIPLEYAIRGLAGVTLTLQRAEPTTAFLRDVFGFRAMGNDVERERLTWGSGSSLAHVDLIERPDVPFGTFGVGIVHHVAWNVPNDVSELAWRHTLIEYGLQVTPVRERFYFRSIYFNEPGGVVFEMATSGPGFTVDEPYERLGQTLMLPPWLEERRTELAAALEPFRLPT